MIIKTYSLRLFEKMIKNKEYKPGDYFISITHTTDKDEYSIPEGEHYLRLRFDDVLTTVHGNTRSIIAMTPEQADEISNFIKDTDSDSRIHIHCMAGMSRSVAVGECIRDYFGGVIYHSHEDPIPNRLVHNLLKDSLRKNFPNPGLK